MATQQSIVERAQALLTEAQAFAASTPDVAVNVALQANGGVATASSSHSSGNYPPAGANNGDRKGLNWGSGGGWNDGTNAVFPDWLQIAFNGQKTIVEIDVITLQDYFGASAVIPHEALTFTTYGITAYQVQYWNGAAWADVPGGNVTGNNKVWRRFSFPAITTDKIRVLVNSSVNSSYSRIVELEAWDAPSPDVEIPPPVPAGSISYLASYPTPTLGDPVTGINPRRINFGKHTAMAYCPDNGLLYLCGGDGMGHHFNQWSSGAMDTVATYDVTTHTYAEEFAFRGGAGEPTPRGLDFIPFVWSPQLHEFWLGPGFAWNYGVDVYPWHDLSWTHGSYASYSPVTKKFTNRGARGGSEATLPSEAFTGSWDTRRNKLICAHNAGLSVVDPVTRAITRIGVPISSHRTETTPSWYDEATDDFYFVQLATGKVYAKNFTSSAFRQIGSALLSTPIPQDSSRAVVWLPDSKHVLVVYTAADCGGNLNSWKLINLVTGELTAFNGYSPGCSYHNAGAYHPPSRTLVITGGDGGDKFHEYRISLPLYTELPSWVPAVGSVKAISGPGTDAPGVMASKMYLTSAGPGSGTGNNYFGMWTSGCYAREDGALGALVFCSGGDGDYWGNEVYKFSLNTRTWSRECDRSEGLNGVTSTSGDPNFADGWGEHTSPDGTPPPQPSSPHNYDVVEYLPSTLGGGPKGSFLFCTRHLAYRIRQHRHPHLFDLDTKAWRRGSASPGVVSLTPGAEIATWCYDSLRGRYVGMSPGSDSGMNVSNLATLTFSPSTGLAAAGIITVPAQLSLCKLPTTQYWPTGDLMLVVGMTSGALTFAIQAIPLANPSAGFSTLQINGAPPGYSQGYGFTYCPDFNCFFLRQSDGPRQVIYKLTPPASDYLTSAWTLTQITMAGDPVAGDQTPQGLYKRFMYVPVLKSLLWVDDVNGPVYAYRVI